VKPKDGRTFLVWPWLLHCVVSYHRPGCQVRDLNGPIDEAAAALIHKALSGQDGDVIPGRTQQ
jgi:hypothetical protein